MLKISLLTITTEKRYEFLELCRDCILNQKLAKRYEILEWVIIDGTPSESYTGYLKDKINSSFYKAVKYYRQPEEDTNYKIGHLRNLGNDNCKGDFIIVLDDDDYQFPTRIKSTMEILIKNPSVEIVGGYPHYMYDFDTELLLTTKEYKGYSLPMNCSYGYRRKYLENHRYDDNKSVSEEGDFTNNFDITFGYLKMCDSIIQFSHLQNTYLKKNLIMNAIHDNETERNMKDKYETNIEIVNKKITSIMPKEIFEKYKQVVMKDKDEEEFDVSYLCGFISRSFDYKSDNHGGSETHILRLCDYFVNEKKLKVEVFVNNPELEYVREEVYNGIHFKHTNKFSYLKEYKNLILWRYMGGIYINNYTKIKAKHIMIDIHDNDIDLYRHINKYSNRVNQLCFKTNFHQQLADFAVPEFKDFPKEKRCEIYNGVDIEIFEKDYGVERDYNRMVYAHSYFRGLDMILKYIFPMIRLYNPKMKLYLCYGMSEYDDVELKNEIQTLIDSTEGVYDLGKISKEEVSIQKHKAFWNMYISDTPAEIFCISLVESLVSGCIPIVSDKNIFQAYNEGIQVKYPTTNECKNREEFISYLKTIGNELGQSICEKNPKDFEEVRINMRTSEKIKRWNEIADEWYEKFKL